MRVEIALKGLIVYMGCTLPEPPPCTVGFVASSPMRTILCEAEGLSGRMPLFFSSTVL